ncbi:MAG: outer membrane beta-barrel protein [Woeseiaceae bacterium]|nr:outer membrane beta-barrel protein [Woeseiaceae bacterium]
MQNPARLSALLAGCLVAAGIFGSVAAAQAQDGGASEAETIDEVVTTARLKSGAAALTDERMEVPFSADYLSFEVMARAGDSDIAAALRRVPGLTVIDGKFVYVRGLGERYSSVQVNRAAVPSPDLTRSVIPLDLFPVSIVEAVKIQKSPSPDQPASFGGGSIDIRTTGIPDDFTAKLSVGFGFNDISNDDGLDYPGTGSALPGAIRAAIPEYRGDISIGNIFRTLNFAGGATLAQAEALHQGLIDSLDTDVAIRSKSLGPDLGGKVALGNSWYMGPADEWQLGFLLNATYDEKARTQSQRREGIGNPDVNFVDIERTAFEERLVGAANVGLRWRESHAVQASYYLLQNDEDQVSVTRGFDQNNEFEDGDMKTQFDTRLEERELELVQVSGDHAFFDTPVLGAALERLRLGEMEFEWFASDSEARTDIPNQTSFQGGAVIDTETGTVLGEQLLATTSMGTFSFLELDDEHSSWGGTFSLPVEFANAYATVSAGWWGSKKSRSYYGYNVNLNSVGVPSGQLSGGVGDVLDPGNLTVDNGFTLSLGTDTGNESYIAAQKVDAGFGMVDWTWDETWRVTAGARWEDYQQAVLPVDLLDFSGNSILLLNQQLAAEGQRLAIREDDVYASLGLTYMNAGLFGADDYQFRFSFGETVVRPDLREISDVKYNDPELDIRVGGNPLLTTSPIDNFELRGEFYYSDGDNFTVSAFYKGIDSPIERIRTAGSDDNIELTFVNAEAGEVYGVEFEGLVSLPWNLFVAGNVTLSDSELEIDTGAITGGPTNSKRRLTGHSEWVVNTTLGYDAPSGRHSAFLNYNAYGERIFYGGVSGNDDAFEQPFHSLGLVYKFFPTDRLEFDFQVDNLLDEQLEFTQANSDGAEAVLIRQDIGLTFGVAARLSF